MKKDWIETMATRINLLDWCKNEGDYGELLLSQWTGIDEDGNKVPIESVSKGSHKRMRWHCPICGDNWVGDIHTKTGDHVRCKKCSDNERSERATIATTHSGENDLLTWCKQHGEYGDFLLEEWVGVKENGEAVSISQIARGSSKPVLWKCSFCGELFPAPPGGRTGKNKRGCPNCNTRSTSYPEQFIFHALNTLFPDAISRGKLDGYEFDIMLPSASTNIEYSPTFTHAEKTKRDEEKALICKQHGIRSISIIEDSRNSLPHYVTESEICFYLDYRNKQTVLKELVETIAAQLNVETSTIDYELVDELAYLRSHKKIDVKESVEYIYPDLIKEWNRRLNKRNPSLLTPYSVENVFWTCTKCHYGENGEWQALLSNRAHLKQGCPACGYNWFDKKVHTSGHLVAVIGKTDFPSNYPELYEEWSFNKNENVNPFELRCKSHKKVFWVCNKCGYGQLDDWKVSVGNRIGYKTGCPACGYNCFDKKYHLTSGTSAIVEGKTDLKHLYPLLCEEWDKERNLPVVPERVKPKSSKKYYWICKVCKYGSDGEWRVSVGDRVGYKTSCPACGYNWFTGKTQKNGSQEVKVGVNDIASTEYYKILEEWHPTLNTVLPTEVTASSHTSIYWECTKCHYGKDGAWCNTLNSRTNQKSGCPVCGYNYYDGTYHKTTGRSVVLPGKNDLATTHKEYAKEWHPTLNGDLTPKDVKAGSGKEVYWQCPSCGYGKDGEWKQKIKERLKRKLLCKNCRKKK